jgi:type VI secretion system protein ImpA
LLAGEHSNIDLEFDERFLIIDQLISEHEADFDAPLRKGKDPFDWARIADDCAALARETRDFRIALWWLRARAEVGGLVAWVDGLSYILELLELPEDAVHPQGDAELSSGELHATALNWLTSSRSLAAFRKLPLTSDAAWSVAALLPDVAGSRHGSDSEQAKLRDALRADQARSDLNCALLNRAKACLEEIAVRLDERAGDAGGDFSELIAAVGHAAHRLAPLTTHSQQLEAVAEAAAAEAAAGEPVADAPSAVGGMRLAGDGFAIHSRDEVRLVLTALERYYNEHESGHPAPIFIQRLQRMVDMSFELLMRELFSESDRLLDRLVKPAAN